MGEKSKIIVVSNQKGGIGKSTVCMALANYLAIDNKFNVGGIIDTDFQSSVLKKREADLKFIAGLKDENPDYPAYEVTKFNLDNHSRIPDLIETLRDTGRFYIFDTPGRINHEGIVALLTFSDYIIVPFNYKNLDMQSTIRFVIFYNNLKERLLKEQNYVLKNKIFFLPILIDTRIGTAKEKLIWEKLRNNFQKIGTITPQINYLKTIQDVNTIRLKPEQRIAVSDSFDTIIKHIFSPEINIEDGKENEVAGS